MKLLRVGVIGLGTIGSRLVEILAKEFRAQARVDFICDRREERIREVRRRWIPRAKALPWTELVDRSHLVIEAASREIALPVARRALKKNKQVLILSVGGLLARDGLSSIANQTKGRLWIPSGALAGVDALLAANQGKIKKVTLTTRKPVRGFEGVPFLQQKGIRLKEIRGERLIFEGSAAQAVRAFPKNINVAATLALAGVGAKRTRVRIFTSPDYRQNRHEVEIVGDFGRIRTEVENLPAPENPRTSALAVLSARATLKKILSRVYIGT